MSLRKTLGRSRPLRTLVAVATTGALLTALAACSGSAGSRSTSGDGKGVVTFMSWDALDTMKPLVTEFEKENPGITIQMSYVPPVDPYANARQKELQSGTAPDVFILGNREEEAGGGFVKDLSNIAAAKVVSDFNKQAESYKGKLYGISVVSWGGGFLVNKDLTSKAGVTTAPQSWGELLTDLKKIKATGVTPLIEAGDGISTTLMGLIGLAAHNDGTDFETDIANGKSTFAKDWTQPLATWSQLYTEGLASKNDAAVTGSQMTDEFNAGRAAMIATGSWAVAPARAALGAKANLDFWPIPGTTSGQNFWAGAAAPAYAINSKAKNPVGAEKWVDFLASAKGVEIYHKTTGSITTTNNYTPDLDPAMTNMYKDVVAGKIYCTWQTWPDANSSALDAEFLGKYQETMLGQSNAAGVTAALDQKWASLK